MITFLDFSLLLWCFCSCVRAVYLAFVGSVSGDMTLVKISTMYYPIGCKIFLRRFILFYSEKHIFDRTFKVCQNLDCATSIWEFLNCGICKSAAPSFVLYLEIDQRLWRSRSVLPSSPLSRTILNRSWFTVSHVAVLFNQSARAVNTCQVSSILLSIFCSCRWWMVAVNRSGDIKFSNMFLQVASVLC